ncbi:hypothetical protein Dimus_004627 [Dionaea muscipula]
MGQYLRMYLVLCIISWSLFTIIITLGLGSSQLQSSQLQLLLQIRKHLEYPTELEIWSNKEIDACYSAPTPRMNVTCLGNVVIELQIMGNRPMINNNFVGYPIPNQTLSGSFSMDSFVTTLSRLNNLRVLRLVSLGIWGSLPDKIHRLSSLEYLDLSSNFLYGSIPPQMSRMIGITTLVLDGNFFNGSVPDWLGSLSNLSTLSLTNNKLKGQLPSSIIRITTLTSLALSNNEISGELPEEEEEEEEWRQLSQLQNLDLSFNSLQGKPPTTIFSLPNISSVNLASNMLSGSLPYDMACGQKLGFVDISNNRLTGGLPRCLSKKTVVAKFFGNCLTVDDVLHQQQHPGGGSYCSTASASASASAQMKKSKKSKSTGLSLIVLVNIIGGVVLVSAFLAFGLLLIFRKYCPGGGSSEQHLLQKQVQDKSVTGVTSELMANARFISQAVKFGTQEIPQCRVFSIDELNEATNNFDSSTLIGEGSRGKMYKGRLQNGTLVAIRCLSLSSKYTIRNFKLRLDLLAKLRHPHLVCLLGHCIDNTGEGKGNGNMNKAYLIYEFMANGNLRSHLSDRDLGRVLKWPERLAILIDIAKAVHFLHTGIIPGFFNNRLKINNILIDEHQRAKLSDYGLSIVSDDDDNQGERGSDPMTWQMKVLEDDIYRFGFIVLESIVGPSWFQKKDALLLNEMVSLESHENRRRILDPIVLSTSTQESLSVVISIAEKCISPDSVTRPSFEDVLWNLQYAAQVQATADGDQRFSSPPNS